jgi:outer membrane receptor protein involved in Fe transport
MKYFLRFFLITITIIFASSNSFSQTGKIRGKITDANSKEPLPFVNVIVVGTNYGAATDIDGEYNIIGIPPGTYSVKASAIGYNTQIVENVKTSIDLTTNIDFQLSETTIELKQEVVVTATRPLVQKDLTSSTSIVNAQDIKALPITSFQDALQLQAGIVKDNNGDFHFRGGRSGEVSYWIDGVPVTDAYNGKTVVDVNTNSIQEMQVVTGAFNAEYGQAMSGIVNIATKSGSNEFHGNITAYEGAYLTSHNNLFTGTNKVNPFSGETANKIHWLEGSLNGPIVNDKLFFYMDARYYYTSGYIFGIRKYNPWDIANAQDPNPYNWKIQQTGDSAIVPMTPFLEAYAQGKLTYHISPSFKIAFNYILDNTRGKDYDNNDVGNGFNYKYNPDGQISNFKKGYLNTFTLTHTLSSSTFYTLGLSYSFRDERRYLDTSAFSLKDLFERKDPFNQKYVSTKLLVQPEGTFYTGGNNMFHGVHSTDTYTAKFDITSQISSHHEIKSGVLFERYSLYLHDINLQMRTVDNNRDPILDGNPFLTPDANGISVQIPSLESPDNKLYLHKPWQFSYYLQDKMEYQSLIVNFGLRFDYFHPDGQILADPSDPNIYLPLKPQNQDSVVAPGGTHEEAVAKRMTYWYKNATDKWQISPRLGVSFPITERGIIHFSYGLFFQLPNFERLYENPGYKLAVTGGSSDLGIIGNPDLKPQQTTSGELGVQQQLTDDIAIDITAYFRDIRNLAGTLNELEYVFGGSKVYSKYVNSDFGFVRGIVFSLKKRFSSGFSANLDYTFQIAKGTASDPANAFNLRKSGVQAETQLIPLNWDQRHILNVTLNYISSSADWGGSIVYTFSSGAPYTPELTTNLGTLIYNSQNMPSSNNIDLRLFKDFKFGPSTVSLFLRVNNLLDTKNANRVFGNTGQPDWSLDEQQQLQIQAQTNIPRYVSSIVDYYTRPGYYSEPRRVEFGTTISF